MFNPDIDTETVTASDPLAAMAELESNSSDLINQMRAHERITLKTKTIAQPGNISQRRELKIQGVSGDISRGGCCILFPIPLNVGDIYWLTFDNTMIDLPSLFARCLRCRMLREDTYECGFVFFEKIDLQQKPKKSQSENLFG